MLAPLTADLCISTNEIKRRTRLEVTNGKSLCCCGQQWGFRIVPSPLLLCISAQWHINSVRCKRRYLGVTIPNKAHVGRESLYVWRGVGASLEVGEKETVGQFWWPACIAWKAGNVLLSQGWLGKENHRCSDCSLDRVIGNSSLMDALMPNNVSCSGR